MGEAKQTADEGGAGQVQNAGRGGLSTGESIDSKLGIFKKNN